MATDQSTVDYILDQMSQISGVSARKMFGEYGIFYENRTIALVCNNQLFLKPTAEGRALAVGAAEMPPYRGAKPSLFIDAERWDDRDWLVELIKTTAKALPDPPPKRQKRPNLRNRCVWRNYLRGTSDFRQSHSHAYV
jgi:DNA transformation protein and related proteins